MCEDELDVLVAAGVMQVLDARALPDDVEGCIAPRPHLAHGAFVLGLIAGAQQSFAHPGAYELVLRTRLATGPGADERDAVMRAQSCRRCREVSQAGHVDRGRAPAVGQEQRPRGSQQHDRAGAVQLRKSRGRVVMVEVFWHITVLLAGQQSVADAGRLHERLGQVADRVDRMAARERGDDASRGAEHVDDRKRVRVAVPGRALGQAVDGERGHELRPSGAAPALARKRLSGGRAGRSRPAAPLRYARC